MKGSIGVTDNDWSDNGLRRPGAICFALHGARRAQGTRKFKAESKNRRQWSGGSRNGIRLMALGTRQPGIDVVNFLPKTTRQKDRG